MTVLVTGAGGAIGSAVADQLLELGEEVIVQDLNEQSLARFGRTAVQLPGDLLDDDLYKRLREVIACRQLTRVIAAHGIDG